MTNSRTRVNSQGRARRTTTPAPRSSSKASSTGGRRRRLTSMSGMALRAGGSVGGGVGARAPVVEGVDLVLDLGREADAVEAVAAQAPHGVAHLADLAHARARVAVLAVDERLGLGALGRVVGVVGHVARLVFDEVVGRVEAAAGDEGAGCGEEVGALGLGHVEVDGLEQAAADEA